MLSLCLSLWCVVAMGAATVDGVVMDEQGAPIAGASVFLEPGLTGALISATADGQGVFHLANVPPGTAGVFAKAENRAFGGRTLTVSGDRALSGVQLVLRTPQSVQGRVENDRGKPVSGACVQRVAVINGDKFSLPLVKLAKLGVSLPLTGAKGQFQLDGLPQGGLLALQVSHPDYAQASVEGIAVGTQDAKLVMETGTLLSGRVVMGTDKKGVSQVSVYLRNAGPPHDTVLAQTGMNGEFTARLRPGTYLCRAMGERLQSSGWEQFPVPAGQPAQSVELFVSALGHVKGTVGDAVKGAPLANVRVTLYCRGMLSEAQQTNTSGEYRFDCAAGEAEVRIESAPGYYPNTGGATRLDVKPNETVTLPGAWLAPLPEFPLEIVDFTDRPVPGAVVTLLHPAQFGWRVSDTGGRVRLKVASWPEDGRLAGIVESPEGKCGALFMLERKDAAGSRVRLLPWASVHGHTVDAKQRPVGGLCVAGVFAHESLAEPLALWQCLSGADGQFQWPAIVPGVPEKCLVRVTPTETGSSAAFNCEPAAVQDAGAIVVPNAAAAASLTGQPFPWGTLKQLSGPARLEAKVVVVAARPGEESMVADGLIAAQKVLDGLGCTAVLLVDGAFNGPPSLPVYSGKPPSSSMVYVIDASGVVRMETFSLPPLRALKEQP